MTAILKTFRKTSNEFLDYTIDWSKWLASGDSLTSSTWTITQIETVEEGDPGPLTGSVQTNTTTMATIWLADGIVGESYDITNSIKTSAGRQEDRTIRILIIDAAVEKTFFKDPNAVLDYTVDWSLWMTSGDSISSVDWTVESGLLDAQETNDADSATIWLSGGTAGTAYKIVSQITTADTRIAERAFEVQIIDR